MIKIVNRSKGFGSKSNERNERIARLKKIIARRQDEKTALVRNSKKDETANKKKMQRTEKIAPKKNMSLKERLEMHRRATKKISERKSERKSVNRLGRRDEAEVIGSDMPVVDLVNLWMDLFKMNNEKRAIQEVEELLNELDEGAAEVLDWLEEDETMFIIKVAVKNSIIDSNVEFAKGLKEGDIIVYRGDDDEELGGEIIDWDPTSVSEEVQENLFDWEAFARDTILSGDVSSVWMNDDFEEVDPDTEGAEEWLVWEGDNDLENARIIEASSTREGDIENLAEHFQDTMTLDYVSKKNREIYFDYEKLLNQYLVHDGYHKIAHDMVIYIPE